MRQAFQAVLALFGVIVIGCSLASLAHLAIGSAAIIGGTQVNPTSDGEDRFFSGLSRRIAKLASKAVATAAVTR